jgi:hypothetical protein
VQRLAKPPYIGSAADVLWKRFNFAVYVGVKAG